MQWQGIVMSIDAEAAIDIDAIYFSRATGIISVPADLVRGNSRVCPYCHHLFLPINANQIWCKPYHRQLGKALNIAELVVVEKIRLEKKQSKILLNAVVGPWPNV